MSNNNTVATTAANLSQLNSILFGMETDFSNAYDCLCHIGELLFEEAVPSEAYKQNYAHFESMFWLAIRTLGRFAGQLDIITGGTGNAQIKNELKTLDDMKALRDWWKTPPEERG